MHISKMLTEEIPIVKALLSRSFDPALIKANPEPIRALENQDHFEVMGRRGPVEWYVSRIDGTVVGSGGIVWDIVPDAHIYSIFCVAVDESHRHQGYATDMVFFLMERIRQVHLSDHPDDPEYSICADADLKGPYVKYGFQKIPEVDDPNITSVFKEVNVCDT